MTVGRWTGREARCLRQALRLSVRDFAEYLGVAARTVARWESFGDARSPRPESQKILDTALARATDEQCVRFDQLRSLGSPGLDRSAAGPLPVRAEGRDVADRAAAASDHLDEIIDHLREQWHVLVRTDNVLGPRFALAGVLGQVAFVKALLPALRGAYRVETLRLGAMYAESASWLYEDSARLGRAGFWVGRAMEWAYEADDQIMLAWTAFRRSQQAGARRDAARVIGLARAALRDEQRLPPPMRAAVRVQEAYGYTLDGDERATQSRLDDAHSWAADDTAGDARGGHGSYCTHGYIELRRASCLLTLGHARLALDLYAQALPTLPEVYRRDRAAALSGLAVAYGADGDPEQAAMTALSALPAARRAGSRRVVQTIAGVSASLEAHRTLPSVRALRDELVSEGV